jgi:hypothetical protein
MRSLALVIGICVWLVAMGLVLGIYALIASQVTAFIGVTNSIVYKYSLVKPTVTCLITSLLPEQESLQDSCDN